jgi:ABC-type oligopeptide transport system substrate-binding subunit
MRKKVHLRIVRSTFFIFTVIASQCFNIPTAQGDPEIDTGIIEGWSYSEIYADPSELDEGLSINAILRIEPSVNGRDYVVTDESGFFAIRDVPSGQYILHPLYSSPSYAIKVAVERNKTSTVTVPTPEARIYLYLFNCSKQEPPLYSADVRRALAMSIDRQRLLEDLALADRYPAANFIPKELREGGWADLAKTFAYSPRDAEMLLQSVSPFACSITYNLIENDMHGKIAEGIGRFWRALPGIEAVTPVGREWGEYTMDYFAGNFDVIRLGWSLDSNSMLAFLREFFGEGNFLRYHNPMVVSLLDQAEAALRSQSIPAYEDAILTVHDILVDEAPAIPIYYY